MDAVKANARLGLMKTFARAILADQVFGWYGLGPESKVVLGQMLDVECVECGAPYSTALCNDTPVDPWNPEACARFIDEQRDEGKEATQW